MKKIVFVCYGMGIGGIEKCLVTLINALPEKEYDVDVLLMNPEHDLRKQIKRKVTFIDSFMYVMNTTDTFSEIKKRGGVLKHPIMFIKYLIFRIAIKLRLNGWKSFKKLKKEYDIAVSYSHHDWSKYYVLEKVNANKKYLFYHDGIYKLDNKQKIRDHKYFPKFDNIIAVSKCTKTMLDEIYPECKSKTIILYNIIDSNEIISLSSKFLIKKTKNVFYITTVGRLVEQKQPLLAVEIAKMLKETGYSFVWNWVGDGNMNYTTQKLIKDYNLEENFILLGNKNNPYPYIKCCDLYVQPSRDEAFCTTTNEARILGRAIVTTNCSGMDEQVENNVTGYIVDNNKKMIYEKIKFLMDNPNTLKGFETNLANKTFNFQKNIQPYFDLFNQE